MKTASTIVMTSRISQTSKPINVSARPEPKQSSVPSVSKPWIASDKSSQRPQGRKVLLSTIDTLKERGYRITAPRRAIVEALLTASSPKTVKEIAVRTKIKDLSTVYRTLSELVKESLAEEFTDRGTSYFELGGHHHDHAVCTGCGTIAHVPCSETKVPASLKKTGWVVEVHEALWRGRCKECIV